MSISVLDALQPAKKPALLGLVVVIGLLVWSIVVFSEVVLLAMALTYLVSGLVGLARRRLLGHRSA